jgi:hypothetical protein
LLVTDLRLTQDAFERSAPQLPVKRHRDRGVSQLAHDDVGSGLPDVLPAGAPEGSSNSRSGSEPGFPQVSDEAAPEERQITLPA